jgi:hypothetical protein
MVVAWKRCPFKIVPHEGIHRLRRWAPVCSRLSTRARFTRCNPIGIVASGRSLALLTCECQHRLIWTPEPGRTISMRALRE